MCSVLPCTATPYATDMGCTPSYGICEEREGRKEGMVK
jgi:hypothetical protein